MDAEKYLRQIRTEEEKIRRKKEEKDRWETIAASTTSDMGGERVQSSGNPQKMADAVIRCVEIQMEIDASIRKLLEIDRVVSGIIKNLPAIEHDLIYKHYIGMVEKDEKGNTKIAYLSLRDIAVQYNKSYPWATAVHRRALKKVQDMMDQKEKDGEKQEVCI